MNLNFEAIRTRPSFAVMKRALVGIVIAASLAGGAARAADAVTLAAQQEMQDNYKRLAATLEEYQTTQLAQQRQISGLSSDVSKLRDEVARNNNDAAYKESIRQLSEQIRKVDEARITDNKRIQEALERLGDAIRKMPVVTAPKRTDSGTTPPVAAAGKLNPPRNNTNSGGVAEEGDQYEIQQGDRLDKIVAKYRAEKIMVTSSSIMAANPNVDWSRLRVGKKIFIPKPKS